MEYSALVDVYDRLGATESNNRKRDILADTFQQADGSQLPRLVTLVRGRLSPAHDRTELGVSSSLTLDAILRATGASEPGVREQWQKTGDLGDAAAWASEHASQQTLFSETLTVERVHDRLRELATFEGDGSQDRRVQAVSGLLADASPDEARYVVRTALGHMRVGIGEGTIRDAIAVAFLDGSDRAAETVEAAYQVTNDYRTVAETARDEGQNGLHDLEVEPFRPVQVMLAQKGESLPETLTDAAEDNQALCEYKYDGVRVQIHVADGDARVYTRRLQDVTEAFPDVVRVVEDGVETPAILDGELVGYTPETITNDAPARDPVAFQKLSQRIKREYGIAGMTQEVPVIVHLFDCLYDGRSLIRESLDSRLDRLDDVTRSVAPDLQTSETNAQPDGPDTQIDSGPITNHDLTTAGLERARAVRVTPAEPAPAESLYQEALEAGHEGLMIKNLEAPYDPGRRVGRLLKVKPTMEPLDLVVTRATYSEGRRSGLLGRLHLGCYDADQSQFREVGRLSTGYTDEQLEALTTRLESHVTTRDERQLQLEPAIVLEVEYEEIQESPEYDSGFALRFPRFLNVREDLNPSDTDTLARVEQLYENQ
ncbi:MAG: ATP-dependent DNA ligase [uncultured archaeon A07HR60]|nr:MAG: ATP-dependent DNA ligase [uncultured archaeon A07HR60]